MQTVQLNHARPAFANVLLAAGFSPNLQKFLKKHPHFTQIHFDPIDKIWYIGYMDENNVWCGAKFLDVLCRGRQASTFSYAKSVYMRFVERSIQFWNCAEYMGRRMFRRWYW